MPGRSGGQTPSATSSARSGKRDQEAADQGAFGVAGTGMDDESGRLVDDDDVGVGVDDFEE